MNSRDPRTEAKRQDEGDLILTLDDWDRAKHIIFWLLRSYGGRGMSFRRTEKTGKQVEVSCIGCNSDELYHEMVGYAKAINEVIGILLWNRPILP